MTAVARNRDEGPRGPKIGLEDVNAAAGEYNKYKREELSRDTFKEDETPIEKEFVKVREFCLESANSNCFLIEKDAQSDMYERIEELTDLRLVHKVRSRVTIPSRQGKLFETYMLDVSVEWRVAQTLAETALWVPHSCMSGPSREARTAFLSIK